MAGKNELNSFSLLSHLKNRCESVERATREKFTAEKSAVFRRLFMDFFWLSFWDNSKNGARSKKNCFFSAEWFSSATRQIDRICVYASSIYRSQPFHVGMLDEKKSFGKNETIQAHTIVRMCVYKIVISYSFSVLTWKILITERLPVNSERQW